MKLFHAAANATRFAISGRKVNFVVAGMQKAGTTALDVYLREHPQICMAMKRGSLLIVMAFSGKPNYFAYHSHFSPRGEHQLVGEATPIYAYWDASVQRIWEYNSEMKLIVVLRNPIERAYSHWNMERQRGLESLPFIEAIRNEDARCREVLPKQHRVYSYLDRGWYSAQIRRIWRFFPKNQCMFIKHEPLLSSPNREMEAVWEFLGVSSVAVSQKIVHARKYEMRMNPEELEMLQAYYKYEIKQIESMLGWDCSDWLTASV
jgi:hypothetical protein